MLFGVGFSDPKASREKGFKMRNLFIAVLTSLFVTSAANATESDHFMSCYGAHHGWYLNFFNIEGSEGFAQLNVVVSTDADPEEAPYQIFQVKGLQKNGVEVQPKAYRWAMKEAVRKGISYGFLKVDAIGVGQPAKQMYLNFNIFGDINLNNAVFIDGYMQSLTCRLL
jgi:hypothetical protein